MEYVDLDVLLSLLEPLDEVRRHTLVVIDQHDGPRGDDRFKALGGRPPNLQMYLLFWEWEWVS